MLIDLYRVIIIILKFLFHDLWIALYRILFGKQNERIQGAYERRIISQRKRK